MKILGLGICFFAIMLGAFFANQNQIVLRFKRGFICSWWSNRFLWL